MKFKSDFCIITAAGFLLAYANYSAIMNMFMPGMIKDLYLVFFVALGLAPLFFRDRKLSKTQIGVLIPWALLMCEILFNRNQDLTHGLMQFFVRTLAGVSIMFMAMCGFRWQKHAMKTMAVIGMPNVIATYVFLVLPGLYKIMLRIYPVIPNGTNGGTAGYRAGLQNHYSQNGTLIAFVLLILGGCLLYYVTEARRMHYPTLIMTVLSFGALILTSKRAHFLFAIAAVCVVYFIANPKQILRRGFILFAAVLSGAVMLYILSFRVDAIRTLFERFLAAGEDAKLLNRFRMWDLAIDLFKKHPIMGIGWGGYKQVYAVELYKDWQTQGAKFLNSHNTYLQLLCETGVTGLIIYLWAVLGTLFTTAKALMYRRSLEPWRRKALYVSVVCQIFVLFYNVTGNTLYDYTIFFYSFTAMTGLAVVRGTCAGEESARESSCPDLCKESYPGALIAETEL